MTLVMSERIITVQTNNGIPEITCEQLQKQMSDQILMIDVRMPEEYVGELGHIQGSQLITMGPDLLDFLNREDKNKEIVFVCRSGARSGAVTAESVNRGFTKTSNLLGGMMNWNRLGFPIVKE